MTWAQIFERIMARFDEIDNRLVALEDRTAELARAEDIDEIRDKVGDLDTTVTTLANEIEQAGSVDEALHLLDELAEAERRRDRLEQLAGARAAMRAAS